MSPLWYEVRGLRQHGLLVGRRNIVIDVYIGNIAPIRVPREGFGAQGPCPRSSRIGLVVRLVEQLTYLSS